MTTDIRCVKTARSQVTVGELYRWILAKLSDKDIKRALHKYRDLMPKQSDWNRKLTQATNIPELGFRYLYRCGQIDESNHRTMQKMLKYIDRQDVLPYFDTILYNTNMSNASIEQLQNCLRDKIFDFISLCDLSELNKVKVGSPYTISQCQPTSYFRLTRSISKRLANGECTSCLTYVKKPRLELNESINNNSDLNDFFKMKSDVSNEVFATKILQCLRQSRQRYRNIPLLHAYSLPGIIEAPFHMLLQSSKFPSTSNTTSSPTAQQSIPDITCTISEMENRNLPNNLPNNNTNSTTNSIGSTNNYFHKDREVVSGFYYTKIRIRIRMDSGNCQDEMESMFSIRTNLQDRQMDILAETSNLLRDREAGEMVCELRCTDVDQLDRIWYDYQTGTLKKRLTEMLLHANSNNSSSSNSSPIRNLSNVEFPSNFTNYNTNSNLSQLKLYVFINKHEYESCRTVLMRNLYPIQVNSNKYPVFSSNNNTNNTTTTTTNNNISNNSYTTPTSGGGGGGSSSFNNTTQSFARGFATTNEFNNTSSTTQHQQQTITDNNNNTNYQGTVGSTTLGGQHRFSAVQHLIAHLREVAPIPQHNQINIWPPTSIPSSNSIIPTQSSNHQVQNHPTNHINVANRPVFMHMFYPQESYIPVTVNPLLRPIHLMTSTSAPAPPSTSQQQLSNNPLSTSTSSQHPQHFN